MNETSSSLNINPTDKVSESVYSFYKNQNVMFWLCRKNSLCKLSLGRGTS